MLEENLRRLGLDPLALNSAQAIPLLLSALVGFLLGLVAVGLLRLGHQPAETGSTASPGDVLVGFLALAAVAMGAFLTYLLVGLLV